MQAIILIGGKGTRLRPLSCTRPKALFPILNKPLLQWTLEELSKNGIEEIILAVNKITAFHIKQSRIPKYDLTVKYSYDPTNKPLGTAGPVKKSEKLINPKKPFIVLNGDIFAEINYKKILESHTKHKKMATMVLHKVKDPSRYGVAVMNESNQIIKFIEKPLRDSAQSNLVNAGAYIFSPEIFQYIPRDKTVSMEKEIFPKLVSEGKLYGVEIPGFWSDIGKPEEYLQTNKILLQQNRYNQPDRIIKNIYLKKPVAISKGVAIGKKSVIGPNAIIGKNVKVGKNTEIRNTIIFKNTIIEDFAIIDGVLIGEGVRIEKKVKISEGCIIPDQVKIREGLNINKKQTICPGEEIKEQKK